MNFKVKKLCVAVEYSLTVDPEILKTILDKDDELAGNTEHEALFDQLMNTVDGVTDVDYDGHYGPNIFIHLDPKYDYSSTWFGIYKIIDDYIK